MAINKKNISLFEQRFVIKSSIAEKYIRSDIYRRTCVVYIEACLSKKNIFKRAKRGLGLLA